MSEQHEPRSFRDYTFNAGPLGGKKVRDISDEFLDWAIKFNRQYINDRLDPTARIRYQGRVVTAGALPTRILQRQVGYAEEALRACQQERAYRANERAMEGMVPDQAVDTVGAAEAVIEAAHAAEQEEPEMSEEEAAWREHAEGLMDIRNRLMDMARELHDLVAELESRGAK